VAVGYDVALWGVILVSRGIGVAIGSDMAPWERWDIVLVSRGGGMAVGSDLAPRGVVLVSRGFGVAAGSDLAPRRRWVIVSTLIICECYGNTPAVPHHLTMLFGASMDLPC
jgi:hypothetical protein